MKLRIIFRGQLEGLWNKLESSKESLYILILEFGLIFSASWLNQQNSHTETSLVKDKKITNGPNSKFSNLIDSLECNLRDHTSQNI